MLTKLLVIMLFINVVLPLAEESANTVNGVPIVGLAAPTILGIFFIMWMRGDIVSGKVHRERVADYKDQAQECREALSVSEEARITAMSQVDHLNEGLRDLALSIRHAIRPGE